MKPTSLPDPQSVRYLPRLLTSRADDALRINKDRCWVLLNLAGYSDAQIATVFATTTGQVRMRLCHFVSLDADPAVIRPKHRERTRTLLALPSWIPDVGRRIGDIDPDLRAEALRGVDRFYKSRLKLVDKQHE